MKLIEKYIEIPIYRGFLGIVLCDSNFKTDDLAIQFDGNEEERTICYASSIYSNYEGSTCYLIGLNFNNKNRPIKHGVIAHEALHISDQILTHIGYSIENGNDEAQAYLVEWIVDQIYNEINKTDFKIG